MLKNKRANIRRCVYMVFYLSENYVFLSNVWRPAARLIFNKLYFSLSKVKRKLYIPLNENNVPFRSRGRLVKHEKTACCSYDADVFKLHVNWNKTRNSFKKETNKFVEFGAE